MYVKYSAVNVSLVHPINAEQNSLFRMQQLGALNCHGETFAFQDCNLCCPRSTLKQHQAIAFLDSSSHKDYTDVAKGLQEGAGASTTFMMLASEATP